MSVQIATHAGARYGQITLNRPEKLNAITLEMIEEMSTALSEFAADDRLRAVVIEGQDGVFSAGIDYTEFMARMDDPAEASAFSNETQSMYEAVEGCPLPVVAKADGKAVGMGAMILLTADVRVVSWNTELMFGEINLGFVPPWHRIARSLSDGLVRELCFTGRALTAEEAEGTGLYNRIVEADELDDAAADLVGQITAKSRNALTRTKEGIRFSHDSAATEADRFRRGLQYQCFDHPDFEESLAAIREDREPDYE